MLDVKVKREVKDAAKSDVVCPRCSGKLESYLRPAGLIIDCSQCCYVVTDPRGQDYRVCKTCKTGGCCA